MTHAFEPSDAWYHNTPDPKPVLPPEAVPHVEALRASALRSTMVNDAARDALVALVAMLPEPETVTIRRVTDAGVKDGAKWWTTVEMQHPASDPIPEGWDHAPDPSTEEPI